MMESFLVDGRQDLRDPSALRYGQSITDACMGWEMTLPVLAELARAVHAAARPARKDSIAAQPPGDRLAPADEFAVRYYRWALGRHPPRGPRKPSAAAFHQVQPSDPRGRLPRVVRGRRPPSSRHGAGEAVPPAAVELTGDSFGAGEREIDEAIGPPLGSRGPKRPGIARRC